MVLLHSDTVCLEVASEPTGKAQSYKTDPPTQQVVTWAADQPGRVSDPSLGSITLLEQLTEFREMFYSLDQQFITEGHNSRAARWRRCLGRGVGGRGASVSQTHRSPHVCTAHSRKLSAPCPLGSPGGVAVMNAKAKLMKSLAPGTDPTPRPSPSPGGQRDGTEGPALQSPAGSLATSPRA